MNTEDLARELEDALADQLRLVSSLPDEFYVPVTASTLRAATARLRELEAALTPFGAFHGVLVTMGGNTPRTGEYCTVVSRSGEASITVEHLARAAQLTERSDEP